MTGSEWMGYLAALAAALTWSVSSLLTVAPLRKLGAVRFNLIRMLLVLLLLATVCFGFGLSLTPSGEQISTLLLSGFVGIFIGDTLLFSAVNRLGPRMAGLLFATNAPMSFLLGWWVLGEGHSAASLMGVGLVSSGVMVAIANRQAADAQSSEANPWETVQGSLSVAILVGLGAAFCQAVGTLIAQPVIKAGIDPVFAAMLRVLVAFLGLLVTTLLSRKAPPQGNGEAMTMRDYAQIAVSGWLAMGLGMTLLLWALDFAPMGVVSTLSSTTPVLVLPLLWLVSGQRPTRYALMGACAVVGGTSLLFSY